jgi:hypothetical protein
MRSYNFKSMKTKHFQDNSLNMFVEPCQRTHATKMLDIEAFSA